MGKRKNAIIAFEGLKEKEFNFGNIVRLYKSEGPRWTFCYVCGYLYAYTKNKVGYITIAQVKDLEKQHKDHPDVKHLFHFECLFFFFFCVCYMSSQLGWRDMEVKQVNENFVMFEGDTCHYGLLFLRKDLCKSWVKNFPKHMPKRDKNELEIGDPIDFQATMSYSSASNNLSNIHPEVLQLLDHYHVPQDVILRDGEFLRCLMTYFGGVSSDDVPPQSALIEVADHIERITNTLREKKRQEKAINAQAPAKPQAPGGAPPSGPPRGPPPPPNRPAPPRGPPGHPPAGPPPARGPPGSVPAAPPLPAGGSIPAAPPLDASIPVPPPLPDDGGVPPPPPMPVADPKTNKPAGISQDVHSNFLAGIQGFNAKSLKKVDQQQKKEVQPAPSSKLANSLMAVLEERRKFVLYLSVI